MKKLFLLLMAVTISFVSFGQFHKFRAHGFAYVKRDNVAVKEDWQTSNVMVTLDLDKQRITIYNGDKEHFDIISKDDPRKLDDGASGVMFHCLDAHNIRADVFFLNLPDDPHPWSITIEYSDSEYMYNMDKITD